MNIREWMEKSNKKRDNLASKNMNRIQGFN